MCQATQIFLAMCSLAQTSPKVLHVLILRLQRTFSKCYSQIPTSSEDWLVCVNASGCTEKTPLCWFWRRKLLYCERGLWKWPWQETARQPLELGAALTSSQQARKGPQSYSFKEMNSTNDLREPRVDFSSAESLMRPSLNQQLDFHLVKMLYAGPH